MGVFDRLPGLAGGDDATQDESTGAERGDAAGDGPEDDTGPTRARGPAAMDPADYRDRAEELAARSNVPTLDFTVASLEKLDTMVAGPTIPVEDPVAIGSYLGETLVRAYDGSWVRDDGPAVAVDLAEGDTTVAVFDAARMALEQGPLFEDVAARLEAEGATPIEGMPPEHREVDTSAASAMTTAGTDRSEAEDDSDEAEDDSDAEAEPDDPADESDEVEGEPDAVEDESEAADAADIDEADEEADEETTDDIEEAPDEGVDDQDDAVEPETTDDAEPVEVDEDTLEEDEGPDGAVADEDEPVSAIGRVDDHERSDAEGEPETAVAEEEPDDPDADGGTVDEGSDAVDASAEPEADSVDASTEEEDEPDQEPIGEGYEPATPYDTDDLEGPAATVATEDESPETADGKHDVEVATDDEGPEPAEDGTEPTEAGTDDATAADDDVDPALDVTVDEIELDEDDEPASPVDPGSLPGSGAATDEGNATAADAPGEEAPGEDDVSDGDSQGEDDVTDGDSLGVADDIADLAASGGDGDAATTPDAEATADPSAPAVASDAEVAKSPVSPAEADSSEGRDATEARRSGDEDPATADEPAPDEAGPPPSRVAGEADGQTPFTAARDDGSLEDLAAELSGTSLPPRPELKRAAREFAESWPDREFDRSPASLARLDAFLDGQWDGRFTPESLAAASPHPRDGLRPLARVGAYVGQVLVETLDGEWVPTEDGEGAVEVEGRGDADEAVPVFDLARECMTGESTMAYQFDALANRVGSEESAREVDDVFDVRDRRADSTAVIPAILDRAEAFTERWPSASLDYAPASLARLDDLADAEFDVAERSGVHVGESTDPDSLLLTERVTSAAAYYATVCVNHLDANWRIEDEVALLVEGSAGSCTVDPVSVAAGAIRGEDTFAGHLERLAERIGRESTIPE